MIVFGTAALGMPYGLPRAVGGGEALQEAEAVHLVRAALASGLETFDTSPAYGDAENRLGIALGEAGHVWTKVGPLTTGPSSAPELAEASLAKSLQSLRRPSVDLLQWHNWSRALEHDASFVAAWDWLSRQARVEALGASTYGADDARAAVSSGLFRCVQVEWSLLNQSVVSAVGALARGRGVSIAARSVLLQGALTDERRALPVSPELRVGVERARRLAGRLGMTLEHLAIRAALSDPHIDHVVVGIDRPAQAEQAVVLSSAPKLPTEVMCSVRELDMGGHPSTDPRKWFF